jgi:hypothetical protein
MLLMFGFGAESDAWWVKGHGIITEAAAARLPEDMPAFFRAAGKQLGHLSGDPDRWKNPDTRHLKAAEQPDHYIDLEDLEGNPLPEDRYKAARLIARLRKAPERTGMLPYAIMEHFDRLSVAFYDYRQILEKEKKLQIAGANAKQEDREAIAAERKAIEMKCVVYAGVLAHYAGDAAMPLHTTVDYDGRTKQKGPDGKKLQVGIHAKLDGFPENHGLSAEELGRGLEAKAIEDVWKHIDATIRESFRHVDRCYELDAAGGFDKPNPDSHKFVVERCRFGSQLIMDLYYTAWQRSTKLPPSY